MLHRLECSSCSLVWQFLAQAESPHLELPVPWRSAYCYQKFSIACCMQPRTPGHKGSTYLEQTGSWHFRHTLVWFPGFWLGKLTSTALPHILVAQECGLFLSFLAGMLQVYLGKGDGRTALIVPTSHCFPYLHPLAVTLLLCHHRASLCPGSKAHVKKQGLKSICIGLLGLLHNRALRFVPPPQHHASAGPLEDTGTWQGNQIFKWDYHSQAHSTTNKTHWPQIHQKAQPRSTESFSWPTDPRERPVISSY